ncbi:carbohydrate porin [Paraburkholderia antibiotica]|uniref:Carbohydrate porin n=1 Tax=Paraburkholderia antibiotica TaxID=2728839 RepID=A0A7X9X7C2_9BURK|nr:carbohydrate porin [Paraburkholderia antibiotica]NML32837.1 carbohydrate porin [Paraburkholderia antibiotica]
MKNIRKRRLFGTGGPITVSAALSLGLVPCAFAQTVDEAVPAQATPPATEPATGASNASNASTSSAAPDNAAPAEQTAVAPTGLWERSTLLGDMGGLRPWLGNYGVTFDLQETSEYMGNVSGGTSRGGAYQGLTQFGLVVDTHKAFGLPGGTFNVSGLQIHGTSLTARNLQTLQTASGIEAGATTRLWELWYQQSLGNVDVKIGQQSLDQEFMVSENAATFMNATFGWPVLPSVDLPAGGPAYPLSSLGVRARASFANGVSVLGGVFDGNPAPGIGDPQRLNANGTNFTLGNGALVIGEVQYAINEPSPNSSNPSDPKPGGLPGTYKLGFWYNSNRFDDQNVDTNGLSLASPASNGMPASHRGSYSFYAVADQMVWRAGPDSPRSLGVFARIMGAPGDRNLVDLGVNAGVTLHAPFKGRDNDVVGLALGYAKIGSHARNLANAQAFYTPGYPSRSSETVLEATYQYQVAPWWLLQADFQYFWRPGGGIPDPNDASRRIGNEAVLGLRTTIQF